jgi:23S rRNA (adenine1618-N6)-methyltransferase
MANSDSIKLSMHPRNLHRGRYDFAALVQTHAALAPFVRTNAFGDASIDFANAQAVKALNQALLKQCYGVDVWDIPAQYLCPPIPGRADYIHNVADLLTSTLPAPKQAMRLLDIGVGANVIYPLIGQHAYGWQFVGADIDANALKHAQHITDANALNNIIELRLQAKPSAIFKGIIAPKERFDCTLCNPPFHASLAEAQAGTQRKWRGLGKNQIKTPHLNFGGQSNELYCQGGEAAFVQRMIEESAQFATQCAWFTTLVSKASNLPSIYRALKQQNAIQVNTIDMAQGQKQSRFVAWTFLSSAQQSAWNATNK